MAGMMEIFGQEHFRHKATESLVQKIDKDSIIHLLLKTQINTQFN